MERKTNILEKIGSLILGYSGYVERDGRRICDKAIRSDIVDELRVFEKEMVHGFILRIKNYQQSDIVEFESIRKSINTLATKIEYAPYGESGFFDNECIKSEELARIYQLDLDLLETLEILTDCSIDDFKSLRVSIKTIEQRLKERNNFISKF